MRLAVALPLTIVAAVHGWHAATPPRAPPQWVDATALRRGGAPTSVADSESQKPRKLGALARVQAMPELPRAQGVSVRWIGLQGGADLLSLFLLAKIVGVPPLELLGSPLVFWTILGPSGFMLGLVMTRINKRPEDTSFRGKIDWENDLIVRLMGGKEDVWTLRTVIKEMTTF
ncbi:hypothetical protein AB1Y20_020998 [Prymnesium parvum]|uniref:Uncharacterized protein n=1 Tax=Prymnesium parvum TaxID=97485 RepID=A0AB34JHK1_PRYPA